jgi:hypothetical protein
MNQSTLPRWSVRLDAVRPSTNHGFDDLLPIVNSHYRVHESVNEFLGPYNARQRGSQYPYQPPERETLKQVIRQNGMNDFSYGAFLNSIIRFCEQHKGLRAIPSPHPSTIHSIQLPIPAFDLKTKGPETEVHVIGIDAPLIVRSLREPDTVKFIIIRPKLSQLGTASVKNWEILVYRQALGYIPDWADSQLNPRYSGVI